MPYEFKLALFRTFVIIIRNDHLREIIDRLIAVWITLEFHMGFVALLRVTKALIALIINNIVATAVVKIVWLNHVDLTAKILQDSEVLQLVDVVNWIKILFARLVGIEISVLAELRKVDLGILTLITDKEPKYEAFSFALFAQELITRRPEIVIIGEEEQVLSGCCGQPTVIIEAWLLDILAVMKLILLLIGKHSPFKIIEVEVIHH